MKRANQKMTPTRRGVVAVCMYVACTVALVAAYQALDAGTAWREGELGKLALTLFGPVLSLFTHLSYWLFVPLSIPLVAFLLMGVHYEKVRLVAVLGFIATWLAIGWSLRLL